jgi:ligand-binding sensor domain-containing protein
VLGGGLLYRDGAGDLWFGSEQGLYRLRGGTLTRYGKQDGLASDDVRVLREDNAGTLWVGTVAGLSRRTQDGFHTLGEADGVQAGRVSALYEDAAGVLWVGTYDGVLYRLATDSGRTQVTRYATEQGLPYDAIHAILDDDHGFFWIGGQRGIYRLARRELEEVAAGKPDPVSVTRLGKEDGLLTPSCN